MNIEQRKDQNRREVRKKNWGIIIKNCMKWSEKILKIPFIATCCFEADNTSLSTYTHST